MKPYQEQNYYELLEVPHGASPSEIRAAYERAVETYSEESVAIYALENPALAGELRQKLREAMEILTGHDTRVEYDRRLGLPLRAEDAAPALAAAELLASSEALRSTHPEVRVAYATPVMAPVPPSVQHVELTPAPSAPPHRVDLAPSPPPLRIELTPPPPPPQPAPRRQPSAREMEATPGIAEQEAIASAEAAMAGVAARAKEAVRPGPGPGPGPKPVELPADAEFSGEVLRRVRESRGLTVQQIADRTRISARHLENIEADRYAALPTTVYLRGILSNLARELGLDQTRVAKSYLQLAAGKKG